MATIGHQHMTQILDGTGTVVALVGPYGGIRMHHQLFKVKQIQVTMKGHRSYGFELIGPDGGVVARTGPHGGVVIVNKLYRVHQIPMAASHGMVAKVGPSGTKIMGSVSKESSPMGDLSEDMSVF